MKQIFVVVNVVAGYAVIAYTTYAEARVWRERHAEPLNYRIDCVGLHEGGK